MAATNIWFVKLFVCFVLCASRIKCDVLCEHGFCSDLDDECFTTSPYCRINNATHTGLLVPSPTICNCCEYCMPFYNKGDHCSLGGAGNGLMVGRCGAGLSCSQETDGSYCRRLHSTCHSAQDDYDERYENGLIGSLEERPLCDGKGKYAPAECVPTQTCFCQSEDGERIFGEVLNRGINVIQNMHCGCSRLNHKIRNLIGAGVRMPVIGPRCTADGNFNPVQCVGNVCRCVNRITGVITTGDSIDLDEDYISELPCYDPNLDLFSDFNLGDEGPYNYTTQCYEDMKMKMDLILESENLGFNVNHFSTVQECMPDGTYGRIAAGVNGSKICIDDKGDQIGSYGAEANDENFDKIDCKCAVTSLLMSEATEKPVCCSNGNFRPIQCRRGVCRCVDSDGRQIGKDSSDVSLLTDCYTEHWRTC